MTVAGRFDGSLMTVPGRVANERQLDDGGAAGWPLDDGDPVTGLSSCRVTTQSR
ncbi:hypothetical protein D3C81_1580000 [compost metagenome]